MRSRIDSGDGIASRQGREGTIEIFRELVSSGALSPVHARVKGHAGAIADIVRVTSTGSSEQVRENAFLPAVELQTC